MIDNLEFEKLYDALTVTEVARIYNINPSTVSKWARKLNIPRKCNRYIDLKKQTLSDKQMEVIVGSLLGDGCLDKISKPGRQSRFTESHSLLQKNWLAWKRDVLGTWVSNFSYLKSSDRESYRLKTVVSPQFTVLEKEWYKRDEFGNYVLKKVGKRMHRIKVLPKNLEITPLALAVWYLDDGHREKANTGCSISTLCFTPIEVDILLNKIQSLGIRHCSKLKQGNSYIIRIGSKSLDDFFCLIDLTISDIPECMMYKISARNSITAG